MQHNRLALNIEQIQKQHQQYLNRASPGQEEQQEEEGSEYQESGEQDYEPEEGQESEMLGNSEQLQGYRHQQQESPEKEDKRDHMYESIETFGNHHPSSQQFLMAINQRSHIPSSKYNFQRISQVSAETPVDLSKSNQQGYSRYSNIDDEVNRIINKVMGKSKPIQWLKQSVHRKDNERSNKIDKINRELLHQNAQLIGEINQHEKKMHALCQKGLPRKNKTKKEETNSSHFQDKSLIKTLKKYRDKLQRALDLKSRLSSRLISQKSKSQIISNTQRSVLHRVNEVSNSNNSQSIGIISTIRSKSINKEKISKVSSQNQKETSKEIEVYCRKCSKYVKNNNESCSEADSSFKRSPLFSPVLQLHKYQINSPQQKRILTEFQIPQKSSKTYFVNQYCQASLDSQNNELQMMALDEEERQLQAIIQKNARTIQQYEERLFKIMEESC